MAPPRASGEHYETKANMTNSISRHASIMDDIFAETNHYKEEEPSEHLSDGEGVIDDDLGSYEDLGMRNKPAEVHVEETDPNAS